jgi:hypothetical protein
MTAGRTCECWRVFPGYLAKRPGVRPRSRSTPEPMPVGKSILGWDIHDCRCDLNIALNQGHAAVKVNERVKTPLRDGSQDWGLHRSSSQ